MDFGLDLIPWCHLDSDAVLCEGDWNKSVGTHLFPTTLIGVVSPSRKHWRVELFVRCISGHTRAQTRVSIAMIDCLQSNGRLGRGRLYHATMFVSSVISNDSDLMAPVWRDLNKIRKLDRRCCVSQFRSPRNHSLSFFGSLCDSSVFSAMVACVAAV